MEPPGNESMATTIRYSRMDAAVDLSRKVESRIQIEPSGLGLNSSMHIDTSEADLASTPQSQRRFSFTTSVESYSPRHPMDKAVTLVDRRRESRDLSPVIDILRTGRYAYQQFNRALEGPSGVLEFKGDMKLRELQRPHKRKTSFGSSSKASATKRIPVVHFHTSMDEAMRRDAIHVANQVLDEAEAPIESVIACNIERTFDMLYQPKWRCFVGRSCAYSKSYVRESIAPHMYFSLGQLNVLLLKQSNE